MTLATLKSTCAAFHKKTASDLTVNGVDLFLVAANNARKQGELLHNFEYCRVQATLDIDGTTGGALSSAVITGDTPAVRSILVAGTLTPDVTGTYHAQGTLNGATLYMASQNWYQVYLADPTNSIWLLQDFRLNLTWDLITANDPPVGVYTAVSGVGIPTVTDTSMGSVFSGVREVVAVQRTNSDGTLSPLDFTRADIPIERDRYKIELSDNYDLEYRYPSDARFLSRGTDGSIIQRKQTLYIYPVPATSVDSLHCTLEGYGWLNDYTAANLTDVAATDFIVEHGFQWLQWAIICELNFFYKTFVPRQEGNLSPPEQARETAWHNLMTWDAYLVDSNSSRPR